MSRTAFVAASCLGLVLTLGCGRSATPPVDTTTPTGVSVGHDVQPVSSGTGAADSLPAAALAGRHVTDVAELLKGRVPGLQVIRLPNGDISLRIRGSDSILQDGEPLLVIDGMPVSEQNLTGALRSLSPREIASIQVLRDVSSTAFYGIRGAHGVILITTKRD